jgi:hypothetical protein
MLKVVKRFGRHCSRRLPSSLQLQNFPKRWKNSQHSTRLVPGSRNCTLTSSRQHKNRKRTLNTKPTPRWIRVVMNLGCALPTPWASVIVSHVGASTLNHTRSQVIYLSTPSFASLCYAYSPNNILYALLVATYPSSLPVHDFGSWFHDAFSVSRPEVPKIL